jgi:hypothetical protein
MTRLLKFHVVCEGASMLFYPAALPLSRQTLTYVTGVIRRHRKQIASPWRKLTCGRQALLVLAYLRKGETFAELAAGFGIGTATAWRYVTETVGLLAARSPKLRKALRDAKKAGYAYPGRIAADLAGPGAGGCPGRGQAAGRRRGNRREDALHAVGPQRPGAHP